MARKKRAGRPKGSKNKTTLASSTNGESTGGISIYDKASNRRGRPPGKKSPGRPAGIKSKRRGRPVKGSSIVTPGGAHGIHFIGRTLIIDTNTMSVDEVIFLGEGSQPKVR